MKKVKSIKMKSRYVKLDRYIFNKNYRPILCISVCFNVHRKLKKKEKDL